MGIFIAYMIKSGFCLLLFYLLYKWQLAKETFFRLNRIMLLGFWILAFLLPAIPLVNWGNTDLPAGLDVNRPEILNSLTNISLSAETNTDHQAFIWTWLICTGYIVGVVLIASKQLVSWTRLYLLIRRGRRIENGPFHLILTEGNQPPFSWMHYIVLSEKDYRENPTEILTHEMAHIRHHHSWDLLLADIGILLQWFNPAAWLLKQEMQSVHEYEADDAVLAAGVDAKSYQLLLIKKAVGTSRYTMANSFNHSSLKKRITMMLKEKSNPWARAKYLYILPLAALAVTAFARPEVSAVADEISAVKVIAPAVHDSIQPNVQPAVAAPSSALDQMPEFPGGMEALNTYLRNNIRYPQEAQKAGIQGRVIIQFIVSKDGSITDAEVVESVDPQLDAEGLRLIKNMPRWKPGMRKGQAIRVKQTLPIRFAFTKTSDKPENSNSIFLKNGSYNSSLKDVILLVNEQEVSPEIFRAIDPQRIQSVTVLKDQASLAKYTTDKSKTGIIQVKLKKEDQASDINIPTIRFDSQTSKSLVIIDGKAADATAVQALSPSQIKSIKVLKGQQAVDLFGEAAKNGAICVSTRSAESETDK